ncbi:unnamed protein product [Vitrella brassicaformis CCMP3155]|uniref:Uncharacterized protein n=1 Tax=Vitrella brassicaformis (strain CCMP3155) TaxID=1169540 RepID=A0A0G4GW23_VITBC|nr:unnamed protein product [Vitrella brassicaformis CCMP3155]|eukprot:CEM34884.1 unnamed protein product [Vitrella brassicaformis CCMP3155]
MLQENLWDEEGEMEMGDSRQQEQGGLGMGMGMGMMGGESAVRPPFYNIPGHQQLPGGSMHLQPHLQAAPSRFTLDEGRSGGEGRGSEGPGGRDSGGVVCRSFCQSATLI